MTDRWERGPDAYRPSGSGDRSARFRALRASGWTGPIDQDGHAVMCRTDSQGRPLSLLEGGDGRGTPDDKNRKTAPRPRGRTR